MTSAIDGVALPAALDGAGRRTVPAGEIEALLRMCGWALAPPDEAATAAHAALERLVAIGLPWADGAGGRRFDPAEVINFVKQARGRGGEIWPRYVATGRALLARSLGAHPHAPPDLADLRPRGFDVEIRRSFDCVGLPAGARLRLRLPLPVESPRLRLLAVEPILPPGAEHAVAPGRLEVRVHHPGTERIDLAVRMRFVAAPAAADADDAANPAWRRDDAGPIAVTPRICDLAQALAGAIADPGDAVRAMHDHLLDAFRCGVAPYDRLPAAAAGDWVLDTGWYDCRLAAALLVALCRARGVPARLVGGYLLWRAPTEHYWAEALIDGRGWLPFDLLDWDLSAGGADRPWRRLLAGATDYRLTTQRLPGIFTGVPGIALPPAWHRLARLTDGGAETRIVAIPDGRVVLTEEVRVRAGPSEPEG